MIFTPIYRRPYQRSFNYTGTKALVPKCEIFDGSDFHDFNTIKSVWGGGGATWGKKKKKNQMSRGFISGRQIPYAYAQSYLRRIYFNLGKKIFP